MLVVALGAAPGAATDFTFTAAAGGGTSGIWGDEGNWVDPFQNPGIPVAGDTAMIGKECRVEQADQAATSVHVTGRLIIKGRALTLTGDSTFTGSATLEFETVGENVPELVIGADLSIGDASADLCTPERLTFFASMIDVADGVTAAFASKCQ